MNFKSIVFVILAIFITIVVMQNSEAVELRVLVWDISIAKIVLLPAFLIFGFIAGYITAKFPGGSKKKKSSNIPPDTFGDGTPLK